MRETGLSDIMLKALDHFPHSPEILMREANKYVLFFELEKMDIHFFIEKNSLSSPWQSSQTIVTNNILETATYVNPLKGTAKELTESR